MRINGNNMELIKQLDEQAKTEMDQDTFARLIHFAVKDVYDQFGYGASDAEIMDLVLGLIEDIPGFEDSRDAIDLAKKVVPEVKRAL